MPFNRATILRGAHAQARRLLTYGCYDGTYRQALAAGLTLAWQAAKAEREEAEWQASQPPIPADVADRTADADSELLRLGQLLDAVWSEQAALEIAGVDIEQHWKRAREIVELIELLPATTVAGLIVKTRACSWCHSGEPFDPDFFSTNGHPTTDKRLGASVLRDLLTIGGKPVPQIT